MANEYGNYCNFNPLVPPSYGNGTVTYTNGNRTAAHDGTMGGGDQLWGSTLQIPLSGKYHIEFTCTALGSATHAGIYISFGAQAVNGLSSAYQAQLLRSAINTRQFDGSLNAYSGLSANDRITFDLDIDNSIAKLTKNGSLIDTVTSVAWADEINISYFGNGGVSGRSSTWVMNSGQSDFTDTPVSGHVGLSTANFPTPAPINYQDEYYIEAGISHTSGSTTAITLPKSVSGGAMARIKRTSAVADWFCFDTVRGAGKLLRWNSSAVEDSSSFTDQNLTGTTFTFPSDLTTGTYLLEVFYMGSYFQIKAYTGTGSAHAETYSAALDTAPGCMVTITRTTTSGPHMYHSALGATKYLRTDTGAAAVDSASRWNDVEPTTTQFTVGTSDPTNANGVTIISYHWANSGPYSFGEYTGNNNVNGPMINLNGYPQAMTVKATAATTEWFMQTPTIDTTNEMASYLQPSLTDPLGTGVSTKVDYVSNGVKARWSSSSLNAAANFIYMAYGIQPLTDGAINQVRADGRVPPYDQANGGTIKRVGDFWVHTFTSSGTFTPHEDMDVEYLVVAGGGGGGSNRGGGGGAGGYRTGTGLSVSAQDYAITVGAGGAGGPANSAEKDGSKGSNSVFSTITSTGGGFGAGRTTGTGGGSGGSGGGSGSGESSTSTTAGAASPSGQGNAGGSGVGSSSSPGGGGAGEVGFSAVGTAAGEGGDGLASSITGTSTYYSGGGGGSSDESNGGKSGGLGGGGAGGNGGQAATAGTANTGGGGGTSGGKGSPYLAGGAGGSGIVIIKYAIG